MKTYLSKNPILKKLLISITTAFILSLMMVVVAGAASKVLPDKKAWKKIWTPVNEEHIMPFVNGTCFSSIKSDSKYVVVKKVVKGSGANKQTYISIKAKKDVKAKVSFKAQYKKEKVNYKITVQGIKYRNPFKYIKVGNKDYTSKYNKETMYTIRKKVSGKLSYKLKPGYKLAEIKMELFDEKTNEFKKVKNGQEITVDKGQSLIMSYITKDYPGWGNMITVFWYEDK